MKITTRQVGPLAMRATMKPDTVNAEKRTVDVIWSAGAKVLRSSWMDGPFYEELDMKGVRLERLNNGAPFLPDHNGYSVAGVLGVVEPGSARVVDGVGICTVRFPQKGVDPNADMIFEKIRDGVVANVSVGYRSHRIEKVVTEGEKIPTYMVRDWTPFEVSAVAMGADDAAGFRSAEPTNEVTIHNEESNVKIKRKFQNPDDGNGGGGAPAAPVAPVTPDPEIAKRAAEQATQIERQRIADINHAVRTAKFDPSFGDDLVKKGISADEARKLVLEELARRSDEVPTENHVRVTAVEGGDERTKMIRGVSAWIFEAAGANGAPMREAKRRSLAEFAKDEIDGGEFRGMGLTDIARLCLDRAGIKHRHVYDKRKLFDLALRASTGDFAVLFENVMYKSMRAAYAVQDDTWRRFCGTDTVQDFREANRFMNGSFGTLPVVKEDEEYKHIAVPDGSKLSISTETRGGIISLSRQALINDDMGALLDVAVRFGRSAGRSIEAAVYAKIAENSGLGPTLDDTNPFFHSSRGNVATSAALSIAAIDADRLKMLAQMDPDANDYLDLKPSILLIAPALESAAKVINESATDHTAALDGKPNTVRGLFSDIVTSPRLSGTKRYLFTAQKEAFKVVFLAGSGEGPTMQTREGFERDGTEWKVSIDFKVNEFDPKTAVYNAGG